MNKIKLTEPQLTRLRESTIPFNDNLYDAIVNQVCDNLDEAIADYEDNPYEHNLYDTIDIQCNFKQSVGNNRFVFGTVFAWFKHWYDFVEAVGINSCKMFVCEIREDYTLDLDNAQPINIDAKILDEKLQETYDLPKDNEDDDEPEGPF